MTHMVLLVSDGLFHPTIFGRLALERYLRSQPGYTFRRVRSLEALPRMDCTDFDAMILYFHHRNISEPALAAFEEYVQAGGGVLAVHSASASFKHSDRYFDVLGGRFMGHGPIEPIQLRACEESSGEGMTFADLPSFTLKDEFYRHRCAPDITVHFQAETKDRAQGAGEPFVWSRHHGQGRVFYLAPGHLASVFDHPQLQEILQRGLAWVCGEAS